MSDKNKETLIKWVGDVHALVSHGLQAVELQAKNLKDENHARAKPAVLEFQRGLESQKAALAARLVSLGGSAAQPVKDAVTAVAGVAAGLINAVRPSETVKSLRDDTTYFSMLGVSYLLLHTTASGLGDRATAAIAETGYRESARFIMHLDALLPKLTLEDLRADGLSVGDIAEETRAMVKGAWDREKPTGF